MTNTTTITTVTKVSKSHPAIKAILAATFPQYKGRSVKVVTGFCSVWGSPAEGGTFRHARVLSLRTMGVVYVHEATFEFWTSTDTLIITQDFFCGKDCGITIHVRDGLVASDLAVLVDALLEASSPTDMAIAAAMCHQMFPPTTGWGSYDKGHEHVQALDLAWVVAQDTAAQLRKGERHAEVR